MKKLGFLIVTLIGGAVFGVLAGLIAGLLLPAETRAKLSQSLVDRIEQMCARVPDE